MIPPPRGLFDRLGQRAKWWATGFAVPLVLITVIDILAVTWKQPGIDRNLHTVLVALCVLAIVFFALAHVAVWVRDRILEQLIPRAELLRLIAERIDQRVQPRPAWDGATAMMQTPRITPATYGGRHDPAAVGARNDLMETLTQNFRGHFDDPPPGSDEGPTAPVARP